jgi:hypothetical protein
MNARKPEHHIIDPYGVDLLMVSSEVPRPKALISRFLEGPVTIDLSSVAQVIANSSIPSRIAVYMVAGADIDTCAHEAYHITKNILERRSITDEEAYAYLLGHLTRILHDYFC